MGLFCGKKCQCKNRCKSWFQHNINYLDGCKAACKDNPAIASSEAYLNKYWNDGEEEEFDMDPFLLGAGVLTLGLIIYFILK